MGVWSKQVWVTCALSDVDVRNCVVLANSIRLSATNRSIAVIVSPSISVNLRNILNQVFDFSFFLEEDRNTAKLKGEDFAQVYALTFHSFETICFLRPSLLVVQNSDDIFNTLKGNEGQHVICGENMDTSVLILKPNLTIFHELMAAFREGNDLSVEIILGKWIAKQTKMPAHINPKFNRKVTFDEDGVQLLGNEKDILIVNFIGLSERSIFELQNTEEKLIGMLGKMTLTYWLTIFNRDVKGMLSQKDYWDENRIPRFQFKTEPIAIVGMSCRYPGSNNLEEFWNLLINGEDATGHPPPFRWTKEQLGQNMPECRGVRAGFLKVPVDEFDSKFFGISPKEVLFMDPQHRILLELIWEGLEDAAIDPTKLRGTSTGVFMGSWTNAFKQKLEQTANPQFYRTYMGNSIGAAAARISFLLGLTGPSIATESGCSSGMVALHLACKSLQNGESNVGLACGVNLLLHPHTKYDLPSFLAEDGRCKTFDAKADGFARAEGCGVLVLKRLSDALKDNDHIWALVRGSAMTQEGISRSMGTPTVDCEALAMELALENANVEPSQVSYVEAHGTGTAVGDPMEVAAIAKAYSRNRVEPLIIGSVKTNVGHTESCSGLTGIMKVVLAMRNEMIPAHINFKTLNPLIYLNEVPAMIPLEPVPWPKDSERRRISGVSSFGITGTDAHAIIEEPPTRTKERALKVDLERPLHILKLSAKTEEALNSVVERFKGFLESTKDSFPDICYTANAGRANFNYRCCLVSSTKEECVSLLKKKTFASTECSEEKKKICFLFTGQGSQYPGMGSKLYETSPVFRMHFDYCSRILVKNYGIDIKEALWRTSDDTKCQVGRTIFSQTGIFCVEYALLRLWQSWDVNPDLVLGHSLGEYCAAVCAGILTPEDALKLVAERSKLIDSLAQGKMLVVKADKPTVDKALRSFSGGKTKTLLDYAAVNSPQQTVVAGDSEVVIEFAKYCSETSIKTMVLDATHAFHSKHMDPILEKYIHVAKSVAPVTTKTSCEYMSGMRGRLVPHSEVDANYWVQHTREKVDFLNASRQCVQLGADIFIEIGPQPVLAALTVLNNDVNLLCVPSLKRNEDEWTTMFRSLEKLYMSGGVDINWEGLDQFYTRNKVHLPSYPFMRKKFWPDLIPAAGETIHPLLGSVIPNASSRKLFQCAFNLRTLEFIKDHCIGDHCIVPGAAYLEMCLAAGHATVESCSETFSFPSRPLKLEDLRIEAPLRLDESKSCQCQVVVDFNHEAAGDGRTDWNDLTVKIYSKVEQDSGEMGDKTWLLHSVGTFTPQVALKEKDRSFDIERFEELIKFANVNEDLSTQFYKTLDFIGMKFGPTFRSMGKIWKNGESFVAKVKVPLDFAQYIVHPVILDAMIQSVMLKHNEKRKKKLYLPIRIGKFFWFSKITNPDQVYIQVSEESSSSTSVLLISREAGELLAKMEDIELIETTLKAVEAILEQQTMRMPDLWEEAWRQQMGPMERRVDLEKCLEKEVYTEEFRSEHMKKFDKPPAEKCAVFKSLEEFTYLNILKCLYEFGWEPEGKAEKFTAKELIVRLGIKEQFSNFLTFFLKTLEEEGVLQRDGPQPNLSSWKVIQMPPSYSDVCVQLTSPVFTNELVVNFEATEFFQRIGENLTEIMKGNRSAMQVLFPDTRTQQDYSSINEFYESYANYFHTMDAFCATSTPRIQHWLNSMEGAQIQLRILEIGAGAGVATKAIFKMMDEVRVQFEYTFTNVSEVFFPAAEKPFEKYKKQIVFKRLNIEEDPITQGFIPEYYDYIVAADVIHATKDVCQSLKNVMKLLRPGGSLDMFEQIQENRIMTYAFGLMENFWKFDDFHLRKEHCTMSLGEWTRALNETGYEVAGVFPYLNDDHATISANRPTSIKAGICNKSNKIWILFWCDAEERLCTFLKEHLELADRQVVTVCSKSVFKGMDDMTHYEINEDSKDDFENLMSHVTTGYACLEGIIYTWSLDKSRTSQSELLQPYFYLCQSALGLKQKQTPKVVCLTDGIAPLPQTGTISHFHSSTLWGFTKSLKNEQSDMNCRCIDITDLDRSSETSTREIFYEIWSNDQDVIVAYNQGHKYVPRFQPHRPIINELSLPMGTDRFQMIHPESKSLADLRFGVLDANNLEDNKIEIQVKASALNFKDLLNILKPTEEFKDSNGVGFDFVGVVRLTSLGKILCSKILNTKYKILSNSKIHKYFKYF